MLDLLLEFEKIPDYTLVGLFYAMLGFMFVAIGVGWTTKLVAMRRNPSRKQWIIASKNESLNRKRVSSSRKKSR